VREGWLEPADSEEQSEDEQDYCSASQRRALSWLGGWIILELFQTAHW
jgi:hypothetical protein